MRGADIVATCLFGLLLACSGTDDCRDGRVSWHASVASHVPLRPDAFGPDWALRLASGAGVLAVSGQFSSDVDLAGTDVTGAAAYVSSFVAAYARDGAFRWVNVLAGPADTRVVDVAAREDGRVVAIGTYQGEVTLGGASLCSTSQGLDVFVVSFDATGAVAWTRCIGSAAGDRGAAVAITAERDVIIAGEHDASIDLGGGALAGQGAFVARLSGTDGLYVWSRELRTDLGEHPIAIAIEVGGDVVVAGHDDRGDLFATARSGADGTARWARDVVTPGEEVLVDVAVDPRDTVFLAGWAVSRPSPETIQRDGGQLVALENDGVRLAWSRTDATLGPQAIAVSASSGVWVTGDFVGTFACTDASAIASAGSEGDAFVARFTTDTGALAALSRYGGPLADGGLGIVSDGEGWIAAAYVDGTGEPPLDAFGDFAGAGVLLFAGE